MKIFTDILAFFGNLLRNSNVLITFMQFLGKLLQLSGLRRIVKFDPTLEKGNNNQTFGGPPQHSCMHYCV